MPVQPLGACAGKTEVGAPGFFRRVGYRPDLESRAFRSLAGFDPDGCREALGSLVTGLRDSISPADGRVVLQLLLDLLNEVNRRVSERLGDERVFHQRRLELLASFGGHAEIVTAREAFLPALDDLLSDVPRPPGSPHPLVHRARSIIEGQYHLRLSLSAVAGRLHVSPSHLSRLFRRDMRMTLTEHIHRVRLAHARRLLAGGGHSIAEIAYRVGYQNYRDFYRNFVKYENASPSRVRQRMAQASPPA